MILVLVLLTGDFIDMYEWKAPRYGTVPLRNTSGHGLKSWVQVLTDAGALMIDLPLCPKKAPKVLATQVLRAMCFSAPGEGGASSQREVEVEASDANTRYQSHYLRATPFS